MVAGKIHKVYHQHGDDGKHQQSFLMDPEEREDACTIEDHLNLTPQISIFLCDMKLLKLLWWQQGLRLI
jgi:hypothetical protein